ncbi:hypothetical protein D3C87_1700220 [compost metagenome]
MNGEHGGAGLGDRRDTLFDRVVDVEQLEIEEHLLARRQQRLAQGQPVGAIEALIADLVEIDAVAEERDDLFGARA